MKKADRIELQTSALVENAYRLTRGCESAEVRSVDDAVRLMCDNGNTNLLNSMNDKVVDWIWRNGTRSLLELIFPNAVPLPEREWEASAYDCLERWECPKEVGDSTHHTMSKHNNNNML